MKSKLLPKKLRQLINIIDTPIDKMKHWLWRDRPLTKNFNYRIRVPMKNKGYYGFELTIYRRKTQ